MEDSELDREAIVRSGFDTLDSMIAEYNSIDRKDYEKIHNCFSTCFSYVSQLEKDGMLIKVEVDHKPINKKNRHYTVSYLKSIIENDGPEYCLTIGFCNPYDQTSIYEIGVCVRGTPLFRKVMNDKGRVMRMLKLQKKIGFILNAPSVIITKNYVKLKSDLKKAGVSYSKVAPGYICFSGKMPCYDAEIEIGIHSTGPVITGIEIFRPTEYYQSPDYDIYQSYADFSLALEKQYGKPLLRMPRNSYGEVSEKWKRPYKISHYIFDRFGLEEHLEISL